MNSIIEQLEAQWNFVDGTGFFGKLKFGEFDDEEFKSTKKILDQIGSLEDNEMVSVRLIELTWFIPTFLHWQKAGWDGEEQDLEKIEEAINFFEQRLTTILGLP